MLITLAFSYSSFAGDVAQETYPHLNSWGDKPAKCGLKPEEAEWLEEQIEAGNLRVATQQDIKTWEDLAKKKEFNNAIPDCGRTYVILRKMEILEKDISGYPIAFILPSEVEFPRVSASSGVYDLRGAVIFQQGFCYKGKEQGIGSSSRNCNY